MSENVCYLVYKKKMDEIKINYDTYNILRTFTFVVFCEKIEISVVGYVLVGTNLLIKTSILRKGLQ